MLQILITPNTRYSLSEMAQMAIEGGCGWLRVSGLTVSDDELKPEAAEIARLCRECGSILTFEGHADLARDLAVHGIYASGTEAFSQAVALRREWGPEAIIGTEVEGAEGARAAESADLDFVSLPDRISSDQASKIIAAAKEAGSQIPFVAYVNDGTAIAEEISDALSAGYSGICVGGDVFNHSDPVAHIEELIGLTIKK